MRLVDLFTLEPAPIYGQYVRRVVFDSTPMEPRLTPEQARANRLAKYRRYKERRKLRKAA